MESNQSIFQYIIDKTRIIVAIVINLCLISPPSICVEKYSEINEELKK